MTSIQEMIAAKIFEQNPLWPKERCQAVAKMLIDRVNTTKEASKESRAQGYSYGIGSEEGRDLLVYIDYLEDIIEFLLNNSFHSVNNAETKIIKRT